MGSPLQRVLYVWQAKYPWDVRVEKICVALRRNGIQVEILARRAPGEPEYAETAAPDSIPIHRVGQEGLHPLSLPVPGNPLWLKAIHDRVKAFRPQLIIARDIPLALPSAQAAKRAGIPMVIDMAEHYPEAMRTWKKYQSHAASRFLINTLKLPDLIEKKSVQAAAGVLPVCEEQKQRLIRDYGIDPARIEPILNTPERERIPPASSLTTPARGRRFGYHGVVIQDRDLITVVRGFDLAAEKNSEIELVIAGGGESLNDVQAEVAKLKHRARITLSGPFKPQDLERLYSEIDFGVVSWKVNTFTNNTIANKFFDYAAFGKPIVYSRTHAMESLMSRMNFGVGYEGSDPASASKAMLEVLEADYATLAQKGRASVEKEFNWDVDVKRMIGFLNQLL